MVGTGPCDGGGLTDGFRVRTDMPPVSHRGCARRHHDAGRGRLAGLLARRFPDWWEHRLAGMLPAWFLYFELEAVK